MVILLYERVGKGRSRVRVIRRRRKARRKTRRRSRKRKRRMKRSRKRRGKRMMRMIAMKKRVKKRLADAPVWMTILVLPICTSARMTMMKARNRTSTRVSGQKKKDMSPHLQSGPGVVSLPLFSDLEGQVTEAWRQPTSGMLRIWA
jgi:hypothetical protein